jgi:CRP/FNR family cyclic AMP-dependent transcriptional regulator
MTAEAIERLLAAHELFRGLGDAHLARMAACAAEIEIPAGGHLFREGQSADRCHLLREGLVALEVFDPTRGALVVDTVDPGDVVGLSWLIPPHRWQLDAHAMQPVRSVALDAACIRDACDADPRLGYELTRRIIRVMWRRTQSARLRLLDVYGDVQPG